MQTANPENKITVIEGPTPTFENVNLQWPLGVQDHREPNSGLEVSGIFLTQLRTTNGNQLLERCWATWNKGLAMNLVFNDLSGIRQEVPIVAARNRTVEEGQVLLLWVRLTAELLPRPDSTQE